MRRLLLYLTTVLHFSTCGATDQCHRGNQCSLCTVTGPAVIDIQGNVSSVQDRCGYTLMKTSSIPDLQVHATFQERHRKDVSFLDRVVLSLNNPATRIYLEQGGRVKVNNTVMTLSTKAQDVHGVALSKDQTGVTAKMSHLNYTMTLFFDGNTAQIHIKGPSGAVPSVEGLCGNSSKPLNELRLSEYKTKGCETQHNDTGDSTINCDKATERCELLTVAPFTACLSNINPQPYVTACVKTLCKYPIVDGLDCQFLNAYARACSLYNKDTLTGWKSKVNCSADPQASCQDRYCSSHEFCGKNSNSGGTRCHCRAIFASTYRSKNTLGDPVVCNKTSRSVSLFACLLEDKGIRHSDLHLYDSACRGELDNVTHVVNIGFDSSTKPCGTVIKMNKQNQIINKNGIMLETTNDELMDLACPFVIPDINIDFSVEIKIKGGSSSSSVGYVTSGKWNYTLTMKAYTDAGRTEAVDTNTMLRLNQRLWFELKVDNLDEKKIALVTDSCFATNEPSASSTLRYDLLIDGCPQTADKTVIVESNGEGTSNYFSFRTFQFTGKNGDVYLHCKMKLCVKEYNSCARKCNPNARRRRSASYASEDGNPEINIMAWGT